MRADSLQVIKKSSQKTQARRSSIKVRTVVSSIWVADAMRSQAQRSQGSLRALCSSRWVQPAFGPHRRPS